MINIQKALALKSQSLLAANLKRSAAKLIIISLMLLTKFETYAESKQF